MKQKIKEPTLILDEDRCRRNIKMMADKAQELNLELRPHFKTHQSIEIGEWFKEYGVKKITVSSLKMANYFSDSWNDITVAFPTNIMEIDLINSLAKKITLNLLVESKETVSFLREHCSASVGIFLKIDVGFHRTGIDPQNNELIEFILNVVSNSEQLKFKGFLAHSGHSYQCRNHNDIIAVNDQSVSIMNGLKSF